MEEIKPEIVNGVSGLSISNEQACREYVKSIVDEMTSIVDINITDDNTYKTFKECKKALNDAWSIFDNTRKDAKSKVENGIDAIMKDICKPFDDGVSKLNEKIHAYEEANCIGQAKAKITKADKKALVDDAIKKLTLVIHCQNDAVKQQIMTFAQDLGATIE